MNLLEAIEVIELFTFTEENDRGIECIKTKLNDEYYFHKKYLFEHDMDALIDYTWQMGNFVKVRTERGVWLLHFQEFQVAHKHRELVIDIVPGDAGE